MKLSGEIVLQVILAPYLLEQIAACEGVTIADFVWRLARSVDLEDFDGIYQGYTGKRSTLLNDALAALSAYDNLDEQRNKCEECEDSPEISAEACGECFPFADDARLKMRAVLARAKAEGVAIP